MPKIRDPRTPEVLTWLASLPDETRLVMLIGMSYAFAYLAENREWKARIDAAYKAVDPSPRQYQEIVERAGEVSGSILADLDS